MAYEFSGPFDLLGDPDPEGWGKHSQSPHTPTERSRNKIRLLLALGWIKARFAGALRIIGKTLTNYYFREHRHRDDGGANYSGLRQTRAATK